MQNVAETTLSNPNVFRRRLNHIIPVQTLETNHRGKNKLNFNLTKAISLCLKLKEGGSMLYL